MRETRCTASEGPTDGTGSGECDWRDPSGFDDTVDPDWAYDLLVESRW